MKKKLLISIDTEGDNLWRWELGDVIRTENTLFLKRFQELCDMYGFKPTYLTNAEMIQDQRFIDFAVPTQNDGRCEIGMHLHAWSTLPEYCFNSREREPEAPYLIEYPADVMEAKIKTMTELIMEKTGKRPVTHRAGRWAMNDEYFELLRKYEYLFDCSVTPHCNWERYIGESKGSKGSNYENASEVPYVHDSGILEIPMTIRKTNSLIVPDSLSVRSMVGSIKQSIKGRTVWFRPNGKNKEQMLWLVNNIKNSDANYIMFMLHSSEFMPGGSPTFKTTESIERLYSHLEVIFKEASQSFEGITIGGYGKMVVNNGVKER